MSNLSKSFFWSFMEQGGQRAISLLVQILLARILAPDIFGIMAIILVFVELATSIAQSGLAQALIQRQNVTSITINTAFWISMAIAVLLYAFMFCIAPVMETIYNYESLAVFLRILSLVIFLNGFNSIQRAILQKEMKFKALFKSNIIATLISGTLGVAGALLGFGVWALIGQTLAQSFFAGLVMLVQVSWRPKAQFDKKAALELYRYGYKICLTSILGVLYTGVSELIIGRVSSSTDLGYYSNGRKYPQAGISVVNRSLENVFFPLFAKLQNDKARFQETVCKSVSLCSYVSTPFCLCLLIIAEPLISLLLTDKWLPSVLVFQFACLSASFTIVQTINLRAYMALGESGLYLKLQSIKVGIGTVIIALVALTSKNIYYVAGVTSLMSIFFIFFVDLRPAKRVHGIGAFKQLKLMGPALLLSVVSAVPAYCVSYFTMHPGVLMLVQIVLFWGIYLGASKLLKLDALEESIALIKRMVSR